MELSELRLRDRRMLAGLVDLVLAVIAAIPMGLRIYDYSVYRSPPLWYLPALVLSVAIVTLHEALLHRSIGKVFTGLYLRRRLGGSVGSLRIAVRCLLKYAPAYAVLLIIWVGLVLDDLGSVHAHPILKAVAGTTGLAMPIVALGSWLSMASRIGVTLHDWLTDTRVCEDTGESRGFPIDAAIEKDQRNSER